MRTFRPTRLFLAFAAFLTVTQVPGPQNSAGRGLASCTPDTFANFPVPGNLIAQIQDSATQNLARDFYYYLTQVELSALQGRQTIFSQYGNAKAPTSSPAPLYRQPTVAAFPFTAAPTTNGSGIGFWGSLTMPGASIPIAPSALPASPAPAVTAMPSAVQGNVPVAGGQKRPASTVLPITSNSPASFILHGSR